MAQTDFPPETTSAGFNAAEQSFFRAGEALERGEGEIDELHERRRRLPSWGPRLLLMGAAAAVALVVVSLASGRRQSGEAIAAVTAPAPAASLPAVPPPEPEAPVVASAAPAMAAAAVTEDARPKARKAKHRKAVVRGKRR